MGKSSLNRALSKIIDSKYRELELDKINDGLFEKVKFFEANAIGQIGEQFVKEIFKQVKVPIKTRVDETVHDEYDILLKNGKKVEIKTARLGKNNSYQFNGLNPLYNYDYIILLGISTKCVKYLIIAGKVLYKHQIKKHYLIIADNEKKLVNMNPGDDKNLKLTLTDKDLKDIDSFEKEIKELIK